MATLLIACTQYSNNSKKNKKDTVKIIPQMTGMDFPKMLVVLNNVI